jgi:hypothetical protein
VYPEASSTWSLAVRTRSTESRSILLMSRPG